MITTPFSGIGLAEGMTITSQLLIQIICVLITICWTAIITFIIFRIISLFMKLRVDEDLEKEGLDMREHGEKGYNLK